MSPRIHVFVYGTLKPEERNYHICASDVIDIQPAIATGRVYHLPAFNYPAMTVEEYGTVAGYRLSFTNSTILATLDEFEQHDPNQFRQMTPHLALEAYQYTRQKVSLQTPQRSPLASAWAYVMTLQQIHHLNGQPIPSGCWNGLAENPDKKSSSIS